MVVKSKKSLKRLDTSKIMTNLKSVYYEERKTQDIMIEYYQIKINLITSILFLIQHNHILSRRVVYKKAIDISRKGSHNLRPNLRSILRLSGRRRKNIKFIAE